ncbi:hypothetical protein C8R43DRAFT_353135, partial [Mycena crocata]
MLFLNVCKSWCDIALATSALWTTVAVRYPYHEDFEELLCIWLKRSANLPLHTSLRGDLELMQDVREVVEESADRVHQLRLDLSDAGLETMYSIPFPTLKKLIISQLPIQNYLS